MKTAQVSQNKLQKGFTLIELLVVIGILAVLLAITLIAINPAKQFASANDTKRQADVNAILNAVNQYMSDNSGELPAGIPTTTAAEIASGTGMANICAALVPEFIAELPVDPLAGTDSIDEAGCTATGGYTTGYEIVQTAEGRVTVSAPDAETGVVISVTR